MRRSRGLQPRVGDLHVPIGLITLLGALGLMLVAFLGVVPKLTAPDTAKVNVAFANAQELREGDPVRIDGVDVGSVERLTAHPDRRGVTVRLAIEPSAGPLYADAAATIRWRSMLGGAWVVDLERGSPSTGALASRTIPERRTSNQVELEDVTSVVQDGSRRGLQTMPREMARTLQEPRAIRRVLDTITDVAPAVVTGLDAVRGREDADLRALVSASARTARALDAPSDDLRDIVEGVATTMRTTARRRTEVRALFAAAPRSLHRARLTFDRLETTLRRADPLIAVLQRSAGDVQPTLARLRPPVVEAARLLDDADPLLRSLRPAVSSLAATARSGLPLLRGLRPGLRRLNDEILPYLAERDPGTQHTTYEMIGPALAVLGGGALGNLDSNGHFFRFPLGLGEMSVNSASCRTFLTNPDEQTLVKCDELTGALRTLLSYNPLAGVPGTAPAPPPGGTGR